MGVAVRRGRGEEGHTQSKSAAYARVSFGVSSHQGLVSISRFLYRVCMNRVMLVIEHA